MAETAEILFWTCLFILVYTYAGYPLIVFSALKMRSFSQKKSIGQAGPLQAVTLIVAAYNEEKMIREKIRNCLALNYPPDLLRLLFITDGSTDNTARIVAQHPGITLLHQPLREGKVAALNRAMPLVTTPIVIFSDANTLLGSDSVKLIMAHYGNDTVGGVAGEKRILKGGDAVHRGEGLYWKYESALKTLDSALKTTVGAAGELFSMRTSLFTALPANTIIEDFVQSLLICQKGYVVRYEPGAYAQEAASWSLADEMERKIRISAGAFQAMGMVKALFDFRKFPVVAFELISHRILRWTACPLALVILFVASLHLFLTTASPLYGWTLFLQIGLYIMAGLGWWASFRNIHIKLFYLSFYFVFMHLCVFIGFARFVRGRQPAVWRQVKR